MLNNKHVGVGLLWVGSQWNLPSSRRLVRYEAVTHADDVRWAPARFEDALCNRPSMCSRKLTDAFWVGVSKPIDRLAIVTNDRQRRTGREFLNKCLFGLIEVLILINQYVLERWDQARCRILPGEGERKRNKLANQRSSTTAELPYL